MNARPKVYRARTGLICAALACCGLVGLVAVLGLGGISYFSWQSAHAKNQSIPWWTVAGCAAAAVVLGWVMITRALKVFANAGKKLTFDDSGMELEHHRKCSRFDWDQISRVERDDRLNEQSHQYGIVVALFQQYVGCLLFSSLAIHTADDRVLVITPFFERYEEICGRVQREFKRRAQD